MPDHSVVHRYARCNSYPEWGVGTVSGIYFTGDGDDVQQWARVKFAPGVRTVPAGSLQFVDFSKPDPAHDRVQRFMTAAQHAMAEGKPRARRPAAHLRARRRAGEHGRPAADDARLLAGGQPARGRALRPRLGARRARPADAAPLRRAHLRGHGRHRPRGGGRRPRRAPRAPNDADAWERVGRLRLRLGDRDRAIDALETARRLVPEPRRAARSRPRVPARGGPRRRGQRVRARACAWSPTARPRGRGWPTRWRGPIVSARRSTPASTRSPSRPTTRSTTSSPAARRAAARAARGLVTCGARPAPCSRSCSSSPPAADRAASGRRRRRPSHVQPQVATPELTTRQLVGQHLVVPIAGRTDPGRADGEDPSRRGGGRRALRPQRRGRRRRSARWPTGSRRSASPRPCARRCCSWSTRRAGR